MCVCTFATTADTANLSACIQKPRYSFSKLKKRSTVNKFVSLHKHITLTIFQLNNKESIGG